MPLRVDPARCCLLEPVIAKTLCIKAYGESAQMLPGKVLLRPTGSIVSLFHEIDFTHFDHTTYWECRNLIGQGNGLILVATLNEVIAA